MKVMADQEGASEDGGVCFASPCSCQWQMMKELCGSFVLMRRRLLCAGREPVSCAWAHAVHGILRSPGQAVGKIDPSLSVASMSSILLDLKMPIPLMQEGV